MIIMRYGLISTEAWFNTQEKCVQFTLMTDAEPLHDGVLSFISEEFGHADDWTERVFGECLRVYFWRDSAHNFAIFFYSTKDQKYVISMSRSDAKEPTKSGG